MRTRLFLLGLLLAAVGGVAQAKRPATDYAAYAGEPVRGFTYHHLYNVRRNNSRQLVVWTRPSTAGCASSQSSRKAELNRSSSDAKP